MSYTGVKFWVEHNNLKRWTNLIKLHSGFDATFVLDKTTDTANIRFLTIDEPSWLKINQWAVLFIDADSDTLQFNEDGSPANHEQFIVGGYQYFKTMAGYETTVKLIEPIERFRGILGETLSYTNQTSKVQDGVTYVKEPYNCYTALKRWLQVTPANTDDFGVDGNNKTSSGQAWWNRIRIFDYDTQETLKSIPFADDTFNEMSLYDLLFNVFDSLVGRTPTAYFDLDTTTGLPRNIARDEYLLKFLRQDGFDKEDIDWTDLTANKGNGEVCSGILKREDAGNYATGLVNNISNLSPSTTTVYPAEYMYAAPQGLKDVRNLTTEEFTILPATNWGLVLPNKIKNVMSLKRLSLKGIDGEFAQDISLSAFEEERILLEKKQFDASSTDYSDDTNDENGTVSWYIEGDNVIHLRDYNYRELAVTDLYAYLYQVEYEPLIDTRVVVGDEEYTQQVNQTSSQADSGKFGKFNVDYLSGMAKADYTIQRTTENPQLYMGYFGRRVKRGTKHYMITNIALRNRNMQYDVFFQLNENHIRKNLSYQAPQNIRANSAIEYNNLQDRKTVIRDRLRITTIAESEAITPKYLPKFTTAVSALFDTIVGGTQPNGLISADYYPQIARAINKSTLTQSGGGTVSKQQDMYCELSRFVFGNTLNFNMRFIDNAMAGKKKMVDVNVFDDEYPFRRVNGQLPVLYTDAFGEVQKTDIIIGRISNVELPVNKDSYAQDEMFEMKLIFDAAIRYPSYSSLYDSGIKQPIITINSLNLQKDMLENFNITYSLGIDTSADVIACEGLYKHSRLMTAKNENTNAVMRVYFFDRHISADEDLTILKSQSIMDMLVEPTDMWTGAHDVDYEEHGLVNGGDIEFLDELESNKYVFFMFGAVQGAKSVLFTHNYPNEEKVLIVNDEVMARTGKIKLWFK